MSTNIRQLKDPVTGDVFYPQTDIAGLVSGGGPGIDAVPTAGSVKPVQSGGVAGSLDTLLSEIYDDRYLLSVLMPYIEMGENKFIWRTEAYGNIQRDGSIEESSAYKYSKLFPIKPNTTYTKSGLSIRKVALYDVNGVFKRLASSDTFTTAKDEVYMRLNSNAAIPTIQTTFVLTEGSTAAEFTTPYVKIKWDILPSDLFDEVNSKFEVIFAEVYKSTSSAYTSSGYISINGEEKAGTAGRRTGYLAYSGGDVIACGRSTDMVPLMVFFSGQSSENCLGYYPNPRTAALNQKLEIVKASDIPAGTTYIRFNGNAGYTYYNNLTEMPTYATADALASEVTRATNVENNLQFTIGNVDYTADTVDMSEVVFATGAIISGGRIATGFTNPRYSSQINVEGYERLVFSGLNTASSLAAGYAFYSDTEDTLVEYKRYVHSAASTEPREYKINVPVGAKYFRFTWYAGFDNPYVIGLVGASLAERVDALDGGHIKEQDSYYRGELPLYREDYSKWYDGLQEVYKTVEIDGTTITLDASTTYAQVLSLYDALVELAPDYITKTSIGTISGTDFNGDSYSYTLYEYAFVPKRKTGVHDTRKFPKFLIDSGIHGFEKNGVYGLYYFLKDVVENWDKDSSLAAFRHHVELRVIPVSNPWGFDNNIRNNPNNINLNRNFPVPNWQESTEAGQQSGAEPLDQQEAKIVSDWILANNDVFMGINIHTDGQYNAGSWADSNHCMVSQDTESDYYNRLYKVFTYHIEEQTFRFRKNYSLNIPYSTFFGIIQSGDGKTTTRGTLKDYYSTTLGVLGMTLEVFNGISINNVSQVGVFSTRSEKMCSEIIGNLLLQILREYADEH